MKSYTLQIDFVGYTEIDHFQAASFGLASALSNLVVDGRRYVRFSLWESSDQGKVAA